MNYVIKTPGRTGSHRILDYLVKNQNCRPVWNLQDGLTEHIDFSVNDQFAVHDRQNNFIPKQKDQWVCIISLRKNKFEQILSYLTAKNTDEFAFYTDKSIKLEISLEEFESVYDRILREEHQIFDSIYGIEWHQIETIFFEDISTETLNRLDYNTNKAYDLWGTAISEKSPRSKTDVFINYQQLKSHYDQMIKNK